MLNKEVSIFSENDRIDLADAKINLFFENFESEDKTNLEIVITGYCNYKKIKKMINLKVKNNNNYSINFYFEDEIQKYFNLKMLKFNFLYQKYLFKYEIRFSTRIFSEEKSLEKLENNNNFILLEDNNNFIL